MSSLSYQVVVIDKQAVFVNSVCRSTTRSRPSKHVTCGKVGKSAPPVSARGNLPGQGAWRGTVERVKLSCKQREQAVTGRERSESNESCFPHTFFWLVHRHRHRCPPPSPSDAAEHEQRGQDIHLDVDESCWSKGAQHVLPQHRPNTN